MLNLTAGEHHTMPCGATHGRCSWAGQPARYRCRARWEIFAFFFLGLANTAFEPTAVPAAVCRIEWRGCPPRGKSIARAICLPYLTAFFKAVRTWDSVLSLIHI